MRKALLKDSLREIKKTFSRFLAILAIVAISIAFFTGIKITCPDMKNTADRYYDNYRLMDFHLVSNVGFNSEDIQFIKKMNPVKGVSPSYTIDAIIDAKNSNSVVRIHSLVQKEFQSGEDYINRPLLISGRLPEKSGECVIENKDSFDVKLNIGSQIKLISGKEETLNTLKTDTFTVVGIVKSPLYVSKERGNSNIGTGKISSFMMINESDFNIPVYNSVYVTMKGADGLQAYSEVYDNKIKSLKLELEKLSIPRIQTRFKEIKADPANMLAKNITEVKWNILDRNTNTGYVDYGNAADRMSAIAQVFPLIFILVGILICLTAMGRMVDEQRAYIGTLKALGYTKISIAGKYLLYAALACILGGVIGVFIGFSFFPSFIFNAYSALYTMPKLILTFDVPFAILSIGVGIAATAFTVLFVCFEELQSSAAALLRPKAPKPGKIILLERIPFLWKRLKFTHKVTARNLLRYKSRFFMTVIGVAGCTALLLVGFGLQDSVGSIGTKQFSDIYIYQMNVNIKDNISAVELENINKIIVNSRNFENKLMYMSKSITIGMKNLEEDCSLVVPKNKDELPPFISLRERVSKKIVVLNDDGIILTEKLARKLGAAVGDEIFIKISDYEKQPVKVTGICENYLNHFMYMSPKLYQKIFNTEPAYNNIYVKLQNLKNNDEDILSKNILSQNGVSAVYLNSHILSGFKDTIKSINYVVIILIVSAGLLSFIVLYTLTNINISERMREIATIKVLGFYDREVSAYVFRENIILTLIGSGVGLILGYYLAMFVIQTAEVEMVMFGREIVPFSYILAAAMTILFALFVNFVMLRKIRNINMVEAMKTFE